MIFYSPPSKRSRAFFFFLQFLQSFGHKIIKFHSFKRLCVVFTTDCIVIVQLKFNLNLRLTNPASILELYLRYETVIKWSDIVDTFIDINFSLFLFQSFSIRSSDPCNNSCHLEMTCKTELKIAFDI